MLLDHHYNCTSKRIVMGRTVTIDSDEDEDPLASRLLGSAASNNSGKQQAAARPNSNQVNSNRRGGLRDNISEYDSSESPSDRDDEVLSSAGSDDCDSNSSCGSRRSRQSSAASQTAADKHRYQQQQQQRHHQLGVHHNNLQHHSTSSDLSNGGVTAATACGGGDNNVPVLEIREVWSNNLYEEFMQICKLVTEFPFVAMDTEFPGIVAKPMGNFSSMDEYKYQLVKCNVDLLKMIQLGVTLFDANGRRPDGVCTWQFNFKFSLSEDLYAEESIDLLMQSGIRFDQHCTEGIEPSEFAEMLLMSGLVLMDNVTWLTFHSAYDFGYLLSQLTCQQLPESETEFLDTLRVYFPNMYDIKYLMSSIEHLNGGLQKVANELRVKRIGSQHQAGSDSLLTGQVFFKMYEDYFKDGLDDVKYNGFICGLGGACSSGGTTLTTSSSSTALSSMTSSGSMMINNGHMTSRSSPLICNNMMTTTNSITSTPSKSSAVSSHHTTYLMEEVCYEMEDLRVNNLMVANNMSSSPARVH